MQFFPVCLFLIAAALLPVRAVELYTTDFSNFTPGADRIAGAPASGSSPAIPATDGWTGSHAGQDRSGILAEADHAILGIGNAAYLGGNTNPILTGSAAMFVRKTFNYNPVTAGNEVVTIRVLAGLKDSTGLTRDNFEFLIYNNNRLENSSLPAGAFPLAGIQFDNSRINPQTSSPYKAVYRYGYDTASQTVRYVDTGITFVYDTLQELEIRINFRTNLWSAWLDTVPLFSDITCYIGPYARNLGSLLIQCRATTTIAPGSNYLLFDDLSINAEPPDAVTAPELTFTTAAGARLRWFQEAGYRYEIKYANTLSGPWLTGLPGAISTAGSTGFTGTLTDATATGAARRFYQLTRSPP
jgi:hypothetical protein